MMIFCSQTMKCLNCIRKLKRAAPTALFLRLLKEIIVGKWMKLMKYSLFDKSKFMLTMQ
ncbi:hypothetical protein Pjdr2_4341 [Paenibacillus sp. JDR-2]|nr:hypothetical protein Pjdr2_4341 [Paenibacillus sp. JDR-2]